MENDHTLMNIVPLEMDRNLVEASAESQNESSLSNSLDSGVTVESSRGDADSKLDLSVWTNEKHNSYLDYLENSFVRQLYSFLGGETRTLSTPREVQSNSRNSTDQYTVLQNGCWQKVNFGKKKAHSEKSSESRFQKNSFRSSPTGSCTMITGVRFCNEESKHSGDKASTRTPLRDSVGFEYMPQSIAEASGQNFREGEEEEEKVELSSKREREANNDDIPLKEDQVVPVRMVKPRTGNDINAIGKCR